MFIEKKDIEYPETEEKVLTGNETILKAEDKAFLEEITNRYHKNRQHFQFDRDFNERLLKYLATNN